MNGVAMARNGPRLWENEATGYRKVFRWLRGLWDAIKNQKWLPKSGNGEMPYFCSIFYIRLLGPISPGVGSAAWAEPY